MADKWDKGRWSKYFNERSKPPAEKSQDKGGRGDQGGQPPTHGLQGGPTPPGSVRRDVDRQVREQAARARAHARMREQEAAKRAKQSDLSRKSDAQNRPGKEQGGKGSRGAGPGDNGPGKSGSGGGRGGSSGGGDRGL